MIREADQNHDGTISFEEFALLNDSISKRIDEKVECEESFKLFTTNGRMYAKNIQAVFENLGISLTEEEAQHMILENSSESRDYLNLQDWSTLFKKKIGSASGK